MKRNQWILGLFLCVFSAFVLQSCDKDDDPEELIAANSDFANFASWTLVETVTEPNALLGEVAHGGQSETAIRKIYIKDGAKRGSDGYPIGTVIVKHTSFEDSDDNAYLGMVKRGNDFDTDRGDWEYFILNAAGEIQSDADGDLRGDSAFKMCGGCHTIASDTDYIFTTN